MVDLDAISKITIAVKSAPYSHPWRASRLGSLGNWLARRYERTGYVEDLEEAIRQVEKAVNTAPSNHLNRPNYLTSLGNMLVWRFKRTGNLLDIRLAIRLLEEAMKFTPSNSPDRAIWLNLATIIRWKYEKTGDPVDLRNAITRAKEALKTIPEDHPNRAASLSCFGDLLYFFSSQCHTTKVNTCDCVSYYTGSWERDNAPPVLRLRSALKATRILSDLGKWEDSSNLLYQMVHFLPSISSQAYNLTQQDHQHMLREFSGLSTLAAATALQAGKDLVEAL